MPLRFSRRRRKRPDVRNFRPFLEQLEDRSLLATIEVNSTLMVIDPADRLCTLKEAINAANSNVALGSVTGECVAGTAAGTGADTITLPAGTYTLTDVENLGAHFGLPGIASDITIIGAGAAKTILERSRAPGTPDFAFFDNRQNTGHLALDGLTLSNGRQAAYGGAIVNLGGPTSGGPAALTVKNVVFVNNTSTNGGGGAISGGGTISDSTFIHNIASLGGGAIYGQATVTNSTFSDNTATGGSADGGAVASLGDISVSKSTFLNNTAGRDGGALVSGGAITVTNSVFSGNMATGAFGSGGAILALGGSITNNLFISNSTTGSQGNGGAVSGHNLTISGTTFQSNSAGNEGGAINGGAITIVNSTFSGNRAVGNGGAISSGNGNTYNNLTITANSTTSGRGGGISFGSSDVIKNSLIAGNTSEGTDATPDCSTLGATPISQGHNLIGVSTNCGFSVATGDQIGTSAAPIDPHLGPLAANGGVAAGSAGNTLIIPTHSLLTGSPALDAGSGSAPGSGGASCEATDQRGVFRPLAQSSGVPAVCDIGAGEFVPLDVAAGLSINDVTVTEGHEGLVTAVFTVSLSPPSAETVVVDFVTEDGTATGGSDYGSISPKQTLAIRAGETTGTITIAVLCDTLHEADETFRVKLSNPLHATIADDFGIATILDDDREIDLSVEIGDSPSPIFVNNNVTYTVTVHNSGPDAASGITLVDTLPQNATFVSATPSQGNCTGPSGGTLNCNLTNIVAQATATVAVVVTATTMGTISNSARVSASERDTSAANDTATHSTTINPPPGAIAGQKFEDFDGDGIRDPGEAGLDDWEIQLVDPDTNAVVATTVTQSIDLNQNGTINPLTERGLYGFGTVAAGSYEIREVPQRGARQTSPVHAITELISATVSGNSGNDRSHAVSMDGNGRFVAFSSLASDLVPGDTNNFEDIFVFDRQLHTTERVSVGAGGVQSNGGSFRVAISANGQFVAFDSAASNLVPGDTNNHLDIFVFDRQAQTTERVSVGANNTESNQDSSSPSISADARFIAFQSKATNLVAGDNSGLNQDIFLFNRESRATQNVSVRRYGGAVGDSSNPAISPDGTAVVFSSLHQGLVSNDTNNAEDVFLYTRTQSSPTLGPLSNSITLISRRPPGASTVPTNGPSFSPSVSNSTPFGRIVVFSSRATNIVGGDDNNTEDIFVAEFVGSLFRISRFTNGNQRSFTPSISADGQFIAFASDATNLVAGDTNGVTDIFIVPTFRSQTGQDLGYERISVNTNGDQATSPGEAPAIAGNGKSVAFRSAASTLALGDTNGKNDIFVREGLYIPPRIVTVPSGQRVAGIDFGDYFPFSLATISGTVFLDSNVNGTHDANEPVLAGETIFADSNNNGSLDLDEHTSTTLADGSYRIGLLPGTHLLRVLVPTGPVTAPAGGFHSITLSHAGEILADRDFGVSPAPGGTVVSGPGTVILNGRTVAFSGETSVGALQVLPGGKLAGTGTVIGQVTSAGRISPGQSPGILTIDGNYTQTTTGTLTIELGGLESGSEHDQLVVFGNASLDGTLEVALVDGFMPQAGDQFQILGYDQRVGNFAVISGLDLGNGLVLVPTYTAVGLTLVTQSNNPHPWQNPANALDVSDDTHVTSIDALLVINYLNAFGSGLLPTDGGLQPPFLDVNGDGSVSSIDALLVINFLNSGSVGGEGESASMVASARAGDQASPPAAAPTATNMQRHIARASGAGRGYHNRNFDLSEAEIDTFFTGERNFTSDGFVATRRSRRP